MEFRLYAGPADQPSIDAVRAAVIAHDGDTWMPGPDDSTDPADLAYCLLVQVEGRTVGYTWMPRWTEADGTRLYLLLGWVVPEHRGQGIGRELLAWQEANATELAATERIGIPILGANISPANRALIFRHDFELAFTKIQLACTPTIIDGVLPPGFDLRPVTAEHMPLIHATIEECFASNRHGYTNYSFAEFEAEFVADADLTLWFVAWEGDEIAGLAISALEPDGSVDTPWVAVRPKWRRRGLARALMCRTVNEFVTRGYRRAVIGTILENNNDTVGLYESVGYRIIDQQPRYRKPVRLPPQ